MSVVMIDPSGRVRFIPVSIAQGESLSGALDLLGFMVKGFVMPASFDGTTLTFQACATLDGTYQEVFDSGGAALAITVAANRYVTLVAAEHERFSGLRFIKVRSGTSGAPVTQSAKRDFKVVATASLE